MPCNGTGPQGAAQDARSQTGVAGLHDDETRQEYGEMAERFKAPVLTALQEQREQCRATALARRAQGTMPGVKPASPVSMTTKRGRIRRDGRAV